MGQNVSLQLVRPVELFIAACVASATTTNAGEMWEPAEEQCIDRSHKNIHDPSPQQHLDVSLGATSAGVPPFQPFWGGARTKQAATGT